MTYVEEILDLIKEERSMQITRSHGGDTPEFDKENTQNDWVAYIAAYAGRAADKVARNDREGQTFDDNIVKVAALCVAALQARREGLC
jgi:hypothetical protein